MKRITKHLLPRYIWFMLWYKQWFKNTKGIKGFAHQIMNWLMQRTMPLAQKLKKENTRLAEAIKMRKQQLAKWYEHPIVEADEYDEVRNAIRKLGFWITTGIIAEAALNYFGVSAVITPTGWSWIALNALIAIVFTGFGIYIFKRWFAVLLNKPKYKETETKHRNWIDLCVITILCVAYEAVIYYLCRIRGIALEGANGDSFATYFVTLAGMLLPLIAGYFAYERSRYLSAYRNTNRIAYAERKIASDESTIAQNKQKMVDHFKKELQDCVAVMEEFKTYKENYNQKYSIPTENIAEHFCKTHDTFEQEAKQRYTKEVLNEEVQKPTIIIAKEQLNGQAKQLPETTLNY